MQITLGLLGGIGIGFFLATLLWKFQEKDPVLLIHDIGGVIQNTVKETSNSIVQALWNPHGDTVIEVPSQETENMFTTVEDEELLQVDDMAPWLRPAEESWGPDEVPHGEPSIR